MNLSVVGMGLITPAGMAPIEHTLFLRAGVFLPGPSAFVSPDDEPIKVHHCEWIGAHAAMQDRLSSLGAAALDSALGSISAKFDEAAVAAVLVTARERPGIEASHYAGLRAELRARGCRIEFESFEAAGGIDALQSAAEALQGGAQVVVVLAVDSFVSAEAIDHEWRRRPSEWQFIRPPPSEGAAVLVLCTDRFAKDHHLEEFGRLKAAATAYGLPNDLNDDPADGEVLTRLIREVAPHGPFDLVVGPYGVDELRHHDLHLAMARNARSFTDSLELVSIEGVVGRLGCVGALADLVYLLDTLTHDAAPRRVQSASPFLVWTISRDGTRGIAVGQCTARGSR